MNDKEFNAAMDEFQSTYGTRRETELSVVGIIHDRAVSDDSLVSLSNSALEEWAINTLSTEAPRPCWGKSVKKFFGYNTSRSLCPEELLGLKAKCKRMGLEYRKQSRSRRNRASDYKVMIEKDYPGVFVVTIQDAKRTKFKRVDGKVVKYECKKATRGETLYLQLNEEYWSGNKAFAKRIASDKDSI